MRKMMMIALMALVGVMAYAEWKSFETGTPDRRLSILYNDELDRSKNVNPTWLANCAIDAAKGTDVYTVEVEAVQWLEGSRLDKMLTAEEKVYVQLFKDASPALDIILIDGATVWQFIIGRIYAYTSDAGIRYSDWRVYTFKHTLRLD